MKIRFSDKMHDILRLAAEETLRTGHTTAGADHLMLGLLRDRDNDACRALGGLGIDLDDMKKSIDKQIFRDEPAPFGELDSVYPARGAIEVIQISTYEALKLGSSTIRTSHFLLALSIFPESASYGYLEAHGLGSGELEAFMSEKGMLRDVTEHAPVVISDEIIGALGEQLTNLLSSSDFAS